eukprot:1227559-Amorphochlora_amoeboformis.AAC.1
MIKPGIRAVFKLVPVCDGELDCPALVRLAQEHKAPWAHISRQNGVGDGHIAGAGVDEHEHAHCDLGEDTG